jgi:3-oxoacyl-[acyl-carrier-protein] synthase-3
MNRGEIAGGRAFGPLLGVHITASAVGLPEPLTLPDGRTLEALHNRDVFRLLLGNSYEAVLVAKGLSPDWPEQSAGLRYRRWTHLIGTPPDHREETCVDLGVKAVRDLLIAEECEPEEIDLLLLATTTPHKTTTSSACAVAAELGIQAPCLDLKAGCSSGLFGLIQAALYVGAGFEKVLLVVSETPSKYANPRVQETVMGVGDAAVALLLEPGDQGQGILGALIGSDGQLGQLVQTPGLLPPTVAAIEAGQYYYHGQAAELKQAVPARYRDALRGALAQAGCEPADLDWFLPHQVNRSLTAGIAAEFGLEPAQQIHVIDRYGSTTAAGVLLALHHLRSDHAPEAGQLLALTTVGGGLSWGGLIWRL